MTATYERSFETEVAGVRMRAPMMHIHTVAAGGGSILHFREGRLSGRPRKRRRGSRPGLLPQGRAADRHRLQRHARQAEPAHFPPSSARMPTSRSTPTPS
jgi:5-oxoprolinase (ATP-hydrolysing)